MGKYRKRPVVVEAVQYTVEDARRVLKGEGSPLGEPVVFTDEDGCPRMNGDLWVETLEGPLRASPGDWIVTGVQGERYPCKHDVFAATYDPVEDTPTTPEVVNDYEYLAAQLRDVEMDDPTYSEITEEMDALWAEMTREQRERAVALTPAPRKPVTREEAEAFIASVSVPPTSVLATPAPDPTPEVVVIERDRELAREAEEACIVLSSADHVEVVARAIARARAEGVAEGQGTARGFGAFLRQVLAGELSHVLVDGDEIDCGHCGNEYTRHSVEFTRVCSNPTPTGEEADDAAGK